MKKAIKRLGDLVPDADNRRQHTPRNLDMIERSLEEVGAARSIVIDEDGVVLAGNATVEAAALAGIERVQVVPADGGTIIAVQRSGLTPEQKARLALYDNRAADLAEWKADKLLADLQAGLDLSSFFTADEIAELVPAEATPGSPELEEAEVRLRPRRMLRILVSVPVDAALEARALVDQLAALPGAEVLFGTD